MLDFRLSGKATARVLLSAAFSTSALLAPAASQAQSDPIVFSFATVGDSRQDPSSPDPTTLLAVNPSTGAGAPSLTGTLLPQDATYLQNSKAWSRILRTITTEKVNMLMMNGDEIEGYGVATPDAATPQTVAGVIGADLTKMYLEYAYWRGMIANMFETSTYVLPVPGNHETQCNTKISTNTSSATKCQTSKTAVVQNEAAFQANMGDLINDLVTNIRFSNTTGFFAQNVAGLSQSTAPNSSTDPAITTNQADLSYSFDISTTTGLLHFSVINTDAVNDNSTAPTGWLSGDLAAAKTRGAIKYFVFGHKPAFTYNYGTAATGTATAAGGLDVNLTPRNTFWSLIAQYGATYFSGHEHTVHVQQFADPTGNFPGMPYQVLVGSGGSPFDDTLIGTCPSCTEPNLANPTDRDYAWAVVRVHQSGNVTLDTYAFNDQFGPTQDVLSISGLQ